MMKLHCKYERNQCCKQTRHDQLDPVEIPIGIPSLIFSIKALFMNCSSASTRVVCKSNKIGVDPRQRVVLDVTTRVTYA